MDSCYMDTTSENKQIHELDSLSRKLQEISESFHDMQVKAAILNVEIGMLFDPATARIISQSEETCLKCSKRIMGVVEKPNEPTEDDVNMEG
eukprot:gene12260-2901_t